MLFCWCSIRGNYSGYGGMCFGFSTPALIAEWVGALRCATTVGLCGFGSHTHTDLEVEIVQRAANHGGDEHFCLHRWEFYWNHNNLSVSAERMVTISACQEAQQGPPILQSNRLFG